LCEGCLGVRPIAVSDVVAAEATGLRKDNCG
jgi:hypothetical protein